MASNKNIPIIVAVILAVLILAIGYAGTWVLTDFVKYDRFAKEDFIDQSTYQAMFLTNDQIYFGHLKNISSEFLMLSDVYYVKIGESGAGQLVKLGAIEPHAPQDKMVINKNQVLFWENMRFDSTIVQTIQNMQSKQ